MTESSQLAKTCDRFLEAAQKEMREFEFKEREFRKRAKQERAAQLQLPIAEPDLTK